MVDTELLKSLVDQATLRVKFFKIEMRVGDLDIGKDNEELFQDALTELALTNPHAIQSLLAEESQVLEIIDEKINHLNDKIKGVSETMG